MRSSKPAFAIVLLLTAFIAPAATPPSKSHGLDVAGMDKSVKPGDDFYHYANGTWEKNTPIPPDHESSLGSPGLYGVGALVTLLACGSTMQKRTNDAAVVRTLAITAQRSPGARARLLWRSASGLAVLVEVTA